jgi:hypothetical protein
MPPNNKNIISQIIKEFAVFLGNKLDAIANRNSIGVEIKGAEIITIKGEKGDKGNDGFSIKGDKGNSPSETEVISLIKPLIPKPLKGSKGDRGLQGKEGKKGDSIIGPKGEDGKDGSPDTGEQIISKINQDKEKIIKKEKVEGWKDIESMARTAEANSRLGLRAAGDTVYLADLSSQCNGIIKTFTIPIFRRAIMVTGTDFPTVLFLNNGFTASGVTLTITAENAPTIGAMLGFLYVV